MVISITGGNHHSSRAPRPVLRHSSSTCRVLCLPPLPLLAPTITLLAKQPVLTLVSLAGQQRSLQSAREECPGEPQVRLKHRTIASCWKFSTAASRCCRGGTHHGRSRHGHSHSRCAHRSAPGRQIRHVTVCVTCGCHVHACDTVAAGTRDHADTT